MANIQTAMLAGGCFWGMQELFRQLPGVTSTRVGYTGGNLDNPEYKQVKTGATGHAEALWVEYDADKTSYEKLLQFFFKIHDPTTKDRQGNDIGTQYRSAIFYENEDQQAIAHKVITAVNASGRWPGAAITEVVPARKFYDAENFHQDYLVKYPDGYTCHFVRPDWTLES